MKRFGVRDTRAGGNADLFVELINWLQVLSIDAQGGICEMGIFESPASENPCCCTQGFTLCVVRKAIS